MGKQSVHNHLSAFVYRDAASRYIHGQIYKVRVFACDNGYDTISHYLSYGGILNELVNIHLKEENNLLSKLKNDPNLKDKAIKIIALVIIAAVILLSFDVFTQSKDGRRQIVDEDGGMESELCTILADIEGVGDVDVMLQYDEDSNITGVIVTAQGADNPVVKNNLSRAVMALFNISAGSVEVFEKKAVDEYKEEGSNE